MDVLFAESATREMSSLASGGHVLTSTNRTDERGPETSEHGVDEEITPAREPEQFCDSNTEPLLGRPVS